MSAANLYIKVPPIPVPIVKHFVTTALFATAVALVPVNMSAQESVAATVTIIDHITAGGRNTVELPDALRQRLVPSADAQTEQEEQREENTYKTHPAGRTGYRVQVFSDNNPRTAKSEAGSKQRAIASRFPQYQTYLRYTSPYWRLKVGDFRTRQEADAAAAELRRAFPAYSKEIRVVKDRINPSSN